MKIANPIYDSVFKYLLEDKEVAILFLSTLLGIEILDLEYQPQEFVGTPGKKRKRKNAQEGIRFTISRLDFTAKIKKPSGKIELILIEIQKVRLVLDVLRFRRYIAMQLSNRNNVYDLQLPDRITKSAIPIRPIFFLGYELEEIKGYPVIRVERGYFDGITNEKIHAQDTFVEGLTYDAVFVCVTALTEQQRTELEKMLSIFNQKATIDSAHFININERMYPEVFHPIMKRLHKATLEGKLIHEMDLEDDVMEELIMWDKNLKYADKRLEKAEKIEVEAEKTMVEAEKTMVEAEKTMVEAEKRRLEVEKQLRISAKKLLENGTPKQTVAMAFNVPLANLDNWLKEFDTL